MDEWRDASGSIKNSAKLLDMKRRDMMSSFMAHYSLRGLCEGSASTDKVFTERK